MLFKRISRNDAETAFIVVKNVSGSTMTAGYHAFFDTSTDADGVRVSQAVTAGLNSYAGCIDANLADNGYGLAQVYGYRSAGYVIYSAIVATGACLVGEDGKWSLTATAVASTSGFKSIGFMCEGIAASTASTSANKRIFIRAL